jgi:hypothetical protein
METNKRQISQLFPPILNLPLVECAATKEQRKKEFSITCKIFGLHLSSEFTCFAHIPETAF